MAELIHDLILRVHRRLNVTSLLVTHDLTTALRVADEIGFLYQGKSGKVDPPKRFWKKPVPSSASS